MGPISRRGQSRRVRTEELFAVGEADPASPASTRNSTAPWELEVAGMPVAIVSAERSKISPLRWSSAVDMPPVDMLAGIASQTPTGLLALESADGSWGAAFDIVEGRVVAAISTDEHGQVDRWSAAVHHRSPNRFSAEGERPLWMSLARMFIETSVLESLRRSSEVGTQLTFLRGDVQWIGSRLEPEDALKLDYLLMEHARQRDEFVLLARTIESEAAIVVPVARPPHSAPKTELDRGDESDWSELREADEVALEQWKDAAAVWAMCDGESSVAQTIESSLLGRFRTLRSLVALRSGDFVRFEAPKEREEPSSSTAVVIPFTPHSSLGAASAPGEVPDSALEHVDIAVLASLGQSPAIARETIEDFMGMFPDWITDLEESITAGHDDAALSMCVQIHDAADIVGARYIASLASLARKLLRDGNQEIAAKLVGDLEEEYGEVFRVLVTFHAALE